jgi:hypothetical protein
MMDCGATFSTVLATLPVLLLDCVKASKSAGQVYGVGALKDAGSVELHQPRHHAEMRNQQLCAKHL